ncbi:hypothetical protein AS594_35665 [Streptomyces agglomeratus]|uniref:Uncharacterized protein n=1 Tax=Streptomyces agglomeratus TaxID=285458 RepID=A0A1E5PHG1_9ACTN|nr:hypothetical protein AS594_35665 [Streptomyces agglomeratus]
MTSSVLPRESLHITAAAVPLAGWTAHTVVLHRRLAAAQRDLLTGTLRREPLRGRSGSSSATRTTRSSSSLVEYVRVPSRLRDTAEPHLSS